MSDRIAITRTPVQITDGTNSAHITATEGFIEYADSADSAAWHPLRSMVMDVSAPWVIWMRVASGSEGAVVVTKRTE